MSKAFLPLLVLSLLACCIEVDISVPSFPDMASYFNVPDGMIQLTLAYNFFGFCFASLLYGPLSECYGRRKVMLIGNFLLLVGAAGCVYAPSIQFLLGMRLLQGAGAATSAVVAFAMVADAYQDEKAVRAISIMNSLLTTLMAGAPIAGAFINQAVGWRGNYGLVAIVCLVSWLSLALFLPETKEERTPFNVTEFFRNYKTLLSSLKFVASSFVPSLLCTAYISFVGCASFLYIETFHLSSVEYALHQGIVVGSFSVVSIFASKLSLLLGTRKAIIWGMVVSLLGALSLVMLSLVAPNSPYLTTTFMSIFCIGAAVTYPIVFAESLGVFPEIRGTAASAIMGMRMFLCSSCMGILSYIYDGRPITVSLVVLFLCAVTLAFIPSVISSSKRNVVV